MQRERSKYVQPGTKPWIHSRVSCNRVLQPKIKAGTLTYALHFFPLTGDDE